MTYAGLADAGALDHAFAGAEVVVHLAARVHVMRDMAADPLALYRQVNVEGTRQVLLAARRARVRRVLLVSSVKAVGEANTEAWTEETEPHPLDAYGISKLESEQLALAHSRDGGPEVTVLRLPLVYGPGVQANALRLLELVDRGVPLPFGRVRNQRSLLYVGNAVAAVHAVIEAPVDAGDIFFVSDGVDLSTADLVRVIAAALGRPARLLPVPEWMLRLAGQGGDWLARLGTFPLTTSAIDRLLSSLTVDTSRLRDRTGFVPPFTPDQGWADTVEWYQRVRGR